MQNQPWSGVSPIVSGEPWLCEIATHLKDTLGLGENGIAVISGGISGPQSVDGRQNFPDSAFECRAIDVIGIHGYFKANSDATAGTPWANLFLPGNTLTSRAFGKKLLLVEEWAYSPSESGIHYKKQDIWDQGNALNLRGIPWVCPVSFIFCHPNLMYVLDLLLRHNKRGRHLRPCQYSPRAAVRHWCAI